MILHFAPYVSPLPSIPSLPSRAFGVLTNRPALSPVSALHSAREPQRQRRGTSATATSSHRCAATPQGVSTASRLFSQVPVNPVSPMNWSAVEAGELTSIRVTHRTQRWCLRVQFIPSRRMQAEGKKKKVLLVESMFKSPFCLGTLKVLPGKCFVLCFTDLVRPHDLITFFSIQHINSVKQTRRIMKRLFP